MVKKSPKIKPNKYSRREEFIDKKSFIVIAVEGKKTEPRYFEMLQKEYGNRIKLEIIPNKNHKSSPRYILENLTEFKRNYAVNAGDSYWMVVDVDNNASKLPKIIKDAKSEGYKVAISNPCFEIWLSLHRGDIEITDDSVIFFKEKKEIARVNRSVLTAKMIREADILNKINHGVPNAILYKNIYFEHIEEAIKKSKKLIKNDRTDNFLCEKEHRGKTRVGELVKDIIKKLTQN